MTPQELKLKHPDIYEAWYQEGVQEGVQKARKEAVAGIRARKASGHAAMNELFAQAFPNGLTILL